MTGVKVRDDESFEKALRRFNKFCEKTGILSDIKKHQHFEKPSERRKRKNNAARRKMRKMNSERN
ncbi:MAG: 30S ribosomal protein S21 [candidate division Zixibacteria bacterium]|nr:30S ribosomal protein S21 [candidate division Zixibacteria bacterium]